MTRELPGYAVTATAYVTAWLQSGRTLPDPRLAENVRQLYELVRHELDDDDALGAAYLAQSPRSGKARRTFARDVEQAAREERDFVDALRLAVDRLGAAGGLELLLSHGGVAVVHGIVEGDRRGPEAFGPGLAAALGAAAPNLMLGAAGQAAAAREAATRPATTPSRVLFLTLCWMSVISFMAAWVAGALRVMPLAYAAGVVFLVVATPTTVLYRLRRR
ncbi:hypothetical protein E1193_01115 [Micromonospora sp. KC606]|uniref:hypothetical protein n=1 Tax=Micromonospora sp. KC606 TaxID=2530379 RepID=UPI0010500259|nr:hypothetical protein [Micromonospora sp. KC606]TDC85933.1 hypothetical protein E1193_01115 [Micromonospora sp. KC606]